MECKISPSTLASGPSFHENALRLGIRLTFDNVMTIVSITNLIYATFLSANLKASFLFIQLPRANTENPLKKDRNIVLRFLRLVVCYRQLNIYLH